jgi:predicted peptidase
MKAMTLAILCSLMLCSCKCESQDIKIRTLENAVLSNGTLYRIDSFPTNYIKTRPVDVWVPGNYSKDKKYAVLYMHDGQMLFDSTTTWNKQEWKVDEWASRLMNEGKTKDFIVVGIHNISEIRWQDLFPEKAFDLMDESAKDKILEEAKKNNHEVHFSGDNYLKFLVTELKPFIDETFSTYKDKAHTFVAGSSMGGLMSMYALFEYPEVFEGAACISTHWPGWMPMPNNPWPIAIFRYMEVHVPDAKTHRIYFDYGTKTLDENYPQYASKVDSIFTGNGYTTGNFKNLKFEGMDHSENSWNKRLDIPLTFLLHK